MVLGINIGSSYTRAATVDENGELCLIPCSQTNELYTNSSVFIYNKKTVFSGYAAELSGLYKDKKYLFRVTKALQYNKEVCHIDSEKKEWYAEGIVAILLKKIIKDAEKYTGKKVSHIVVSVPEQFYFEQKKIMQNAAYLIDLMSIEFVSEPKSAVFYYLQVQKETRSKTTFLNIDWGSDYFDVSIVVKKSNNELSVLCSKRGNFGNNEINRLVTKNLQKLVMYDANIANNYHIQQKINELKNDILVNGKNFSEKSIVLSDKIIDLYLTKLHLDNIMATYWEQLRIFFQQFLLSCDMSIDKIDCAILTGGVSTIDVLTKKLLNTINLPIQKTIGSEPLMPVVYGATIQAYLKNKEKLDEFLAHDILVNSIVNETSVNQILFAKQTSMYTVVYKTFYITAKFQKSINLQFYSQEEYVKFIGSCTIAPLPPLEEGHSILIGFTLYPNNCIKIKMPDLYMSKKELVFDFIPNISESDRFQQQKQIINKLNQ